MNVYDIRVKSSVRNCWWPCEVLRTETQVERGIYPEIRCFITKL